LNRQVSFSRILAILHRINIIVGSAEDRARQQISKELKDHPQERVSVAKINNCGLSPALYRPVHDDSSQAPYPDIPIWIDANELETDANIIPKDIVMQRQADIWLSMAEIREHFNIEKDIGQNNEWFACGRVSVSRVEQIMPYNEEGLFERPHLNVNSGSYVFNFQHQMWLSQAFGVYDTKAIEFEQMKWSEAFENFRQIFKQMKKEDYPVSNSDLSSLLDALYNMGDATWLMAVYYLSIGHDGLDEKADRHRTFIFLFFITYQEHSEKIESTVKSLMTSKGEDMEEDNAVDDLEVGIGALNIHSIGNEEQAAS
jgi:hypothetical protein